MFVVNLNKEESIKSLVTVKVTFKSMIDCDDVDCVGNHGISCKTCLLSDEYGNTLRERPSLEDLLLAGRIIK